MAFDHEKWLCANRKPIPEFDNILSNQDIILDESKDKFRYVARSVPLCYSSIPGYKPSDLITGKFLNEEKYGLSKWFAFRSAVHLTLACEAVDIDAIQYNDKLQTLTCSKEHFLWLCAIPAEAPLFNHVLQAITVLPYHLIAGKNISGLYTTLSVGDALEHNFNFKCAHLIIGYDMNIEQFLAEMNKITHKPNLDYVKVVDFKLQEIMPTYFSHRDKPILLNLFTKLTTIFPNLNIINFQVTGFFNHLYEEMYWDVLELVKTKLQGKELTITINAILLSTSEKNGEIMCTSLKSQGFVPRILEAVNWHLQRTKKHGTITLNFFYTFFPRVVDKP